MAAIHVQAVTATSAVVSGVHGRVDYGAGSAVLPSAQSRDGRVVLNGLLPGTRYVVRSPGAPRVSFRTPAAASVRSSVGRNGAILLNGSPFLPVLQWLQCPSLFSQSVALGVNTFLGRGCDNETDAGEVAALRALGVYSVLPYSSAVASAPSLLGWRLDDEPDQKGTPPEKLAHPRDPRHLTFLTLTTGFTEAAKADLYRRYVQAADVIGFDFYPVTGYCRPDWLRGVYDDQRALVALAGGKPTYQWIEAISTASQFCTGRGVEPAELRAEVWLALAGGAKAVGYFTHSWKPTYSQFRVDPAVQAEIKRTDAELAAYGPALLAEPVKITATIPALARRFHGSTFVVAVNPAREATTATIVVGSKTLSWKLGPLGVRIARL